MTEPLLSVVLPNYNHATLLPRALDALLAQERSADEILLVDDGSSDNSRAMIAHFGTIHPSVRPLFHETNRGVVAALMTGIEAARGRFLYMAAADDEVLPGFFRDGLALLERYPEAGLFCGEAKIIDGQSGAPRGFRPAVRPLAQAGFLDAEDVAKLFRRADFVLLTGSALVRRDLALKAGGLDIEAGSFADSLLTRKIAFVHGFCYLPRPVAVWYTFDNSYSLSSALDGRRVERTLAVIVPKLAADPAFPSWYPALLARRHRFATARIIAARLPGDRAGLAAAIGATRTDRLALALIAPLAAFRAGYVVMLAYLTLRFRPYRLRDVLATYLARKFGDSVLQGHKI